MEAIFTVMNLRLAPPGRRWALLAGSALAVLGVLPQTALAQSCSPWTAPPNVIVSDTTVPVYDAEFAQNDNRFVWADAVGTVWIGRVDPALGSWLPASGQFTQVTTGALSVPNTSGNGPDWVYSQPYGHQLAITTQNGSAARGLGKVYFDGTSWQKLLLTKGQSRQLPIGSKDENDPLPRILYLGPLKNPPPGSTGTQTLYWRYLDDYTSEQILPGVLTGAGRWVKGRRSLVYSAIDLTNNLRQIFEYDIDTSTATRLTSDPGNKVNPWMFQAPEFNNEYVFFEISDYTTIGVYRNIAGRWTQIATVKPPSIGTYIASADPFVYDGRSYISMVTSTNSDNQNKTAPTDIWIASIDGSFYRQVSNPTTGIRKNPHVYITSQGPFVYFNAKVNTGGTTAYYRADSGLLSCPPP
ncbi:hypothetical protein GKIL_1370 [Gloeobacter kilaueensis JS1]|uniref:Uncharacterized protein n=2 Tax=Gloeobacter TaxID=33071 RepID=U5QF98_GLOK1|nr:hypothetical protein GKIL_1370 [Gloeobacter kilaueensis JS1]